jgi:hypothetical protein
VAEFPTGVPDCFGHFGCGRRSFEFVDRGQNTHGVSLAVDQQVGRVLVGIFLTE